MAKKKRRKSKKNKGNITLAIMLAVIFIIIGIFVFKAINKDDSGDDTTTISTTVDGFYQGEDDGGNDFYNASQTESESEKPSQTEEAAEISSTTQENHTELVTLPINNEPEDVVDVIIAHYTDFMGFPEGALFIRASETGESAEGYTYTLRLNSNGSPNKLIGDVYVEKGTGKVTDSMGNDSWYISE